MRVKKNFMTSHDDNARSEPTLPVALTMIGWIQFLRTNNKCQYQYHNMMGAAEAGAADDPSMLALEVVFK